LNVKWVKNQLAKCEVGSNRGEKGWFYEPTGPSSLGSPSVLLRLVPLPRLSGEPSELEWEDVERGLRIACFSEKFPFYPFPLAYSQGRR